MVADRAVVRSITSRGAALSSIVEGRVLGTGAAGDVNDPAKKHPIQGRAPQVTDDIVVDAAVQPLTEETDADE